MVLLLLLSMVSKIESILLRVYNCQAGSESSASTTNLCEHHRDRNEAYYDDEHVRQLCRGVLAESFVLLLSKLAAW